MFELQILLIIIYGMMLNFFFYQIPTETKFLSRTVMNIKNCISTSRMI